MGKVKLHTQLIISFQTGDKMKMLSQLLLSHNKLSPIKVSPGPQPRLPRDQRETTSYQTSVLITKSLKTPTWALSPKPPSSINLRSQRALELRTPVSHQSTLVQIPKSSTLMSLPPSRTRRLLPNPLAKNGPSIGVKTSEWIVECCHTLIILRNELNKQTITS